MQLRQQAFSLAALAVLELRDLPSSASQVLALK
ncbi:rCG26238, partial [Rattus norvegicus]